MKKNVLLSAARKHRTPIYVYDKQAILDKCEELKRNFPNFKLFYACKANTNPEIIKIIHNQGFGVETVSPGEIMIARKAGVPISKITFTCGSISESELIFVAKQGVRIHLDSIHQVEIFGKYFPGREISVRLNLHIGAGHHSHVITGGPDSKFGIDRTQIRELKKVALKYNLKITGLHQHIGSNILDVPTFMSGMAALYKIALEFKDLKHLDFGGGFGVPYKSTDKVLDLVKLSKEVKKMHISFIKNYGRKVEISFEPGRYLVAEAGSLLVEVTDVKKNAAKTFVGVNSGLNHLIRHAMYGSYHEIINLNNTSNKKEVVTVAGNICESGDVFAKNRPILKAKIGDILEIQTSGAYGYVMSSEYNSRPKPKEFLISNDTVKRI